ncbi:MAG: PIN domain-containing protein [Trebonia sp.]
MEVIPRTFYEHMERAARRRVPRDPNDWAPVALALALGAAILTGDHDLLGCGCPTWTVETLLAEPRISCPGARRIKHLSQLAAEVGDLHDRGGRMSFGDTGPPRSWESPRLAG